MDVFDEEGEGEGTVTVVALDLEDFEPLGVGGLWVGIGGRCLWWLFSFSTCTCISLLTRHVW